MQTGQIILKTNCTEILGARRVVQYNMYLQKKLHITDGTIMVKYAHGPSISHYCSRVRLFVSLLYFEYHVYPNAK
jgi:hypothetical protein